MVRTVQDLEAHWIPTGLVTGEGQFRRGHFLVYLVFVYLHKSTGLSGCLSLNNYIYILIIKATKKQQKHLVRRWRLYPERGLW